MTQIDSSALANKIRRGYYFLALLSVVLIVLFSWIAAQRATGIIRNQALREHRARAERSARTIADRRQTLQAEMIALAEQRGLRQGLSTITDQQASEERRSGFLQAADASCRAFSARGAGIRTFALRDLRGNRLAGTGEEVEAIDYPYVMQRILVQTVTSEDRSAFSEQWIVPVRDEEAQPLAYLVADVSPIARIKAVLEPNLIAQGELACLEDASGARLWNSDESKIIPPLTSQADHFETEGVVYRLFSAHVPETEWTLHLAIPRNGTDSEANFPGSTAIFFVILAVIIMGAMSLLLSRAVRTT